MKKTRDLVADVGDRSDCKYWASSGQNIKSREPLKSMLKDPAPHYYSGLSKAGTTATRPTSLGFESIESSTRGKPAFNSCVHLRLMGFNYPYLAVTDVSAEMANYVTYWRKGKTGSPIGQLNPLPWSVFDGAQRRAWWSMQPRFEAEVDLLNFIYEMKDFKQIAKTLLHFKFAEIGQQLRDLRNRLAKMRREEITPIRRSGESLRDITRTAAEARLVYSFAIVPLIADVTALFKQLATTIERLQEQFNNRGQASQLSHYSEPGDETNAGTYGTKYNSIYFTGTTSGSLFTATLQYSYLYKMRKGWDLLKRGYGLEVNAEVLWNAIPFSFLVDYFYKIGNAIHAMKTDPNVHVRTLQYCESILQTKISGILLDTSASLLLKSFVPTSKVSVGSKIGLTGYSATLYRRRVCSPNKGAALPRASGPSKGQLWNIAALIRCFL